MTEENKKLNVQYEWERAEESLRVLETLLEGSFWSDAISKAYYGMFYLARALLFSIGIQAKTHGGVVHLLSMHLVRTGDFPPDLVQDLSVMQKRRLDADYETFIRFDRKTAVEAQETFLRFRNETGNYLRSKGYL